jgi:glyoxylase I family protein
VRYLSFSHIGLTCNDPLAVERFYTTHFGFRRARVYEPGPNQVVQITTGQVSLELFPASAALRSPKPGGAGAEYPGWRHIAFIVADLDAALESLGGEAKITLGPLEMGQYIRGMRVCWIADPEGNVIELNEGYVDEEDPPALPSA